MLGVSSGRIFNESEVQAIMKVITKELEKYGVTVIEAKELLTYIGSEVEKTHA